jgi:TonB family protein
MSLENQRRLSPSFVYLIFALWLFAHPFSCFAQESLNARQLIETSNAASDISKLTSFRLQAQVVVQSAKGEATGTLTVDHDKDNTRQELEFKDYDEIRLIRGDTSSLLRKPAIPMYVAERIRGFERLWQVKISKDAETSAVSETKIRGAQELCFTVKPGKDTRIQHCFDPASHLLVSTESTFNRWTMETLFLDYQKIGDVQFPATVRFVEPNKASMEVRKIAVANQNFDAARFAPLPGAREFQTCHDEQPPKLVHSVDPSYPQMARIAHIQGEVRLLVVVGEDGKTHDIRALSGHPILVQSAIDAVRDWKYSAASCPSGPVSVETMVSVAFHM